MIRARPALLVALLLGASACARTGGDGAPGGEGPNGTLPGPVAPTSDVITHSPLAPCAPTATEEPQTGALRIVSWNIHAARSAPLEAIAAELQEMDADVMALQEVDRHVRRTGNADQPATLAAALGVHYVFAASIEYDGGDYGLALLSRWPIASVRRHRLDPTDAAEHRIVLEALVCASGRPLRVFTHHADLRPASRRRTFAELRTIVEPALGGGVVVAGDFNDVASAAGIRALIDAGLLDVGAAQDEPTADGGRIDYLLVDAPLAARLRSAQVWRTARSDHHAVVAEFAW